MQVFLSIEKKSERMSCVTFQLKPVRSLDSLRPAWSGRLRHGPLPISQNNSFGIPPKPKFNPEPPQELLSSQLYDLEMKKNTAPNVKLKENSKDSLINSKLDDKTSLINISSNVKKNKEITNEIINPSNPFVNSNILKAKINGQHNFEIIDNDDNNEKINDQLVENLFDDDSIKNNLQQDPFDTSRVLIPMNPVLHSMNNQKSINSHTSQPLNTEFCSSHAKVKITTHFFFCFVKKKKMSFSLFFLVDLSFVTSLLFLFLFI